MHRHEILGRGTKARVRAAVSPLVRAAACRPGLVVEHQPVRAADSPLAQAAACRPGLVGGYRRAPAAGCQPARAAVFPRVQAVAFQLVLGGVSQPGRVVECRPGQRLIEATFPLGQSSLRNSRRLGCIKKPSSSGPTCGRRSMIGCCDRNLAQRRGSIDDAIESEFLQLWRHRDKYHHPQWRYRYGTSRVGGACLHKDSAARDPGVLGSLVILRVRRV